MGDYDQIARYTVKNLGDESFLRWLKPDLFVRWRFDRWLDTQSLPFPDEPAGERRHDTVAVFQHKEGKSAPMALCVESQTRPDPEIFERLAEYMIRLRRQRPYQQAEPKVKYVTGGAVVNLTGAAQGDTWEMTPIDCEGLTLQSRSGILTLAQESATELLDRVESGEFSGGLLSWLPLMAGGGESETVARWKALARAEPDERTRKSIGAVARVFAKLAKVDAIWEPELKGWGMERSPVVAEWLAEGKALGIAEGKAEGKAEGQLMTARDLIGEAFIERFSGNMPEEIASAVNSQTDLAVLKTWFRAVISAASVEDAKRAVLPN